MIGNIKERQEKVNQGIKKLNKFANLIIKEKEIDKDDLINWFYEKYIDNREICVSALNYFWFLDDSHIGRFNSTVNDDIYGDTEEYLQYQVDWDDWDEDIEKLAKQVREYCERTVALNLSYDL